MTSVVLKIAIASFVSLSLASPAAAVNSQVAATLQPMPKIDALASRAKTASICAMDLAPKAQKIFYAVSLKVQPDTNLKKLVKKNVRPQVISGKLSIKSARKNSKAASACLRILKHGSPDKR